MDSIIDKMHRSKMKEFDWRVHVSCDEDIMPSTEQIPGSKSKSFFFLILHTANFLFLFFSIFHSTIDRRKGRCRPACRRPSPGLSWPSAPRTGSCLCLRRWFGPPGETAWSLWAGRTPSRLSGTVVCRRAGRREYFASRTTRTPRIPDLRNSRLPSLWCCPPWVRFLWELQRAGNSCPLPPFLSPCTIFRSRFPHWSI